MKTHFYGKRGKAISHNIETKERHEITRIKHLLSFLYFDVTMTAKNKEDRILLLIDQ